MPLPGTTEVDTSALCHAPAVNGPWVLMTAPSFGAVL
jgi:hypothetical protein